MLNFQKKLIQLLFTITGKKLKLSEKQPFILLDTIYNIVRSEIKHPLHSYVTKMILG